VTRFAIRPERSGIVDEADKAEVVVTFIIKTSALALVSIIIWQVLFNVI